MRSAVGDASFVFFAEWLVVRRWDGAFQRHLLLQGDQEVARRGSGRSGVTLGAVRRRLSHSWLAEFAGINY